jgi:hypothetical protein
MVNWRSLRPTPTGHNFAVANRADAQNKAIRAQSKAIRAQSKAIRAQSGRE